MFKVITLCFIISLCATNSIADDEPGPQTPPNICLKYPSLRECRSPTSPTPPPETTTPSPSDAGKSPQTTIAGDQTPQSTAPDICLKYPSLRECTSSTPQPASTTTKKRDPYCDWHKQQFKDNCGVQNADPKQKEFCNQYGVQCMNRKRMGQPKSFNNVNTDPQASRSWPRMNGGGAGSGPAGTGRASTKQEDVAYCRSYGHDYYSLCLNRGGIPSDAQAFCADFSQTCPGVPRTGGAPSSGTGGPQFNDKETDQQYCKAYGADYYAMCLRNPIVQEAQSFCTGYSQVCKGVPRPGSKG